MTYGGNSQYLRALKNKIDITTSPFSDRGSCLLVFKQMSASRLDVSLAERLTALYPGIDAYQSRPAYIQDLAFIDGKGTPLDFQWTSYPHVLYFETRLGIFTITFADRDTLVIGLPDDTVAGVVFQLNSVVRSIDEKSGSVKSSHNLSYQSTCALVEQEIETRSAGYQFKLLAKSGNDDALHVSIHRDPAVSVSAAPLSETLAKATRRWEDWFSRVPGVIERVRDTYAYAWWVLANNLADPRGHLKYEAVMPSKAFYIGVWNWDACFHAVALRHVNPDLARDQLRTLLACQLPDGMIPDAIHAEGIVSWIGHPHPGKVTKPPVIAWAALKIHETDPDLDFLAEIYPAVKGWNAWWFSEENRAENGLARYTHPYSSGLDNSPLWDHGFPVTAPDLNTYLYIQMQSLAKMAGMLGYADDEAMWAERSGELLKKMIDALYNDDEGVFLARHGETPIPERTPFNLYPLWCDRLPEALRERLVAHLTNPEQFWTEYPLATVARNSPSFSNERMWRGPVWININYIFVEALASNGYPDLADKLRRRTLDLVANNNGIYEYYDPDTGTPPPTAAPMFSWSAALYIDLALQASTRIDMH